MQADEPLSALKARPPRSEVDMAVLREALETIESAIALFDCDLSLIYANRKFCEIHLAERESQLRGKAFSEIIDSIAHILADQSRDSIVALMGELSRAPDGKVREIVTGEGRSFRFRLDRLSSGDVMFTLRNVTAQRISQVLVQEKTRQLEAILASIAEGVSIFDAEDSLVLANRGFLDLYGLDAALGKVGTPLEEFSRARIRVRREAGDPAPERLERARVERIRRAIAGGRELSELETMRDGRRVEVRRRRIAEGHLVSTYMDVSEREAAIDALRTNEARFRGVVEDQTEMICRFGRDHRLSFVNPAYCKAFGKTEAELIGSCFLDLLVDDEARRAIAAGLAKLTPERPILRGDYAEHTPGGQARWQSWVNRAFFDDAGRLIEYQAVGRDVTREREVKDALARSERHFKSIAEAHPVPVLIFDRESEALIHASPAAVPLLGISAEQIGSIELSGLFASREEWRRFEAAFWPAGRIDQYETVVVAADGRVLPAELTARAVEYESRAAIAFGVVDITERRAAQREIARQQEALAQGEKISALGSLLASVSHELNNPLSIVVAQSQLMEELADDPGAKRRATRVRDAAERCGRIVKTFLSMARQKPPSRVSVALDKLVSDAAALVGYGLRTGDVDLSLDLAAAPLVSGDPDQLIQVVVNLIINAQQALAGRPRPRRITLGTAVREGAAALVVEDNGPGVPEELRERIFEPFFTTKPEGLGTGIGLAVCRNVVLGHGGGLAVEEPTGGGARFVVTLPLCEHEAAASTAADGFDLEAWRALPPQRILVVDDEADIALAIGEMLEADGHQVLTAENGRAALALLRGSGVGLVLSDLRMPGLDGPGLYAAILEEGLHPAERIGFLTGDTLSAEVRRFLDRVPAPLIEKPFQAGELKSFILRLLGG